jgi:hypothetical protein
VRKHLLASIERIAKGEALAGGAPLESPLICFLYPQFSSLSGHTGVTRLSGQILIRSQNETVAGFLPSRGTHGLILNPSYLSGKLTEYIREALPPKIPWSRTSLHLTVQQPIAMAFYAPMLLSNPPGSYVCVFEGRRRSASDATSGFPKTQAKIAAIKVLKIGTKDACE